MSRFVRAVVAAEGGLHAAEQKDSFTDRVERVAKYVPSEVIALFLFLNGIAATATAEFERRVWFGVAFGVCLTLTPIYFLVIIGTPADPRKYQATVSTISFLVWAYALGSGFFAAMHWYYPIGAAFGVGIFSTVSAWLRPTREPDQVIPPA